jgi:hypothetical protein
MDFEFEAPSRFGPNRPLYKPEHKLTRQGNQIKYDVTVEDPEVLVEPWVMTSKILRLNANADAGLLPERGNCEVYELSDITSQIRH